MHDIKSYQELYYMLIKPDNQKAIQQNLEFIVLETKESFIDNYLKVTLLFCKEINEQFIIKSDLKIREGSEIKIEVKDIKFTTFKGNLYLKVDNLKIIKDNSQNIIKELCDTFVFNYNYANNGFELKKIKCDSIVSIPVKIKEKETAEGIQKKNFKDVNKEELIMKFDHDKFNVEGQKIYLLEGFFYDVNECKLIQLPYSNVVEITETVNKNKNIYESDIPNLFNFKGKIKTFNFVNNIIIVENEKGNNQYEVEINSQLFAKISINCECYFFNFSKIKENKYKYNHFSNISYNQKTFLTLNFHDNLEEKYYNFIEFDGIIKQLNNNNIIFEIDDHSNKTSEIKTISYLKKDKNNNIIDNKNFNFEVNCGKENLIHSFSKKTAGYSYQMYFETNVPNSLPEKYVIKDINEKNIDIKPERNNNNFYERFTIINAPFQNINEFYENENLSNFSLNPETNEEKEGKSIKYLFTNNKNTIKMHKFILKPQKSVKIFYDEFEKYKDKLQSLFENYYPKQFDVMEKDIKYINDSEKNKNILDIFSDNDLKKDLKDVIVEGFDKYYFNNCRKEYILLRNICFAFLCLHAKEKEKVLESLDFANLFTKFKYWLAKLSFEYIDKIKALIAITREIYYKKLNIKNIEMKIIKSKTKDKKYIYYAEAMKKFLNIISRLTENCAFYKTIRQFNSIILEDTLSKKNMYSGSILNIQDIQLELYKNIGQFCIIQTGIPNLYGSYWSCARTIFINPDTIFDRYYLKDSVSNNIMKRATSGTLFVIFHEAAGHLKTHINNETDSPNQVYVKDFDLQEIKMTKNDSGFLFEHILSCSSISCKYFVDSSISEDLLNEELYLEDNFDNLQSKLKEIKNALSPNNNNVNYTTEQEKKQKELNEKIEDINLNYNKMTVNELLNFFSSLDDETMSKMEKSEAYAFFLTFFDEKGKKV